MSEGNKCFTFNNVAKRQGNRRVRVCRYGIEARKHGYDCAKCHAFAQKIYRIRAAAKRAAARDNNRRAHMRGILGRVSQAASGGSDGPAQ